MECEHETDWEEEHAKLAGFLLRLGVVDSEESHIIIER